MAEARFVVSIRELEQVKLLLYQLDQLRQQMVERGQPEAKDLQRILERFTATDIEDDRP